MPKSKLFPYPLALGTHVIAKVRRLDLTDDEIIAGTVVRVISPGGRHPSQSQSVSYAVRTQSGAVIQALASRTTPIDTSTPEGLDQWLDTLEDEPDPALLPGTDLSDGGAALQQILWNGPVGPTDRTLYYTGWGEPPTTTTRTISNP